MNNKLKVSEKNIAQIYLDSVTDQSRPAMMRALWRAFRVDVEKPVETGIPGMIQSWVDDNTHLNEAHDFIMGMTAIQLEDIINKMQGEYSESTIQQTVVAVKGAVKKARRVKDDKGNRLIHHDDYIDILEVKAPKVPIKETGRAITKEDKEKLKACIMADDTPRGKMHLAIISLFWFTGIRVSELASLNRSDYDRRSGVLSVNKAKGGGSNSYKLANNTKRIFDDYLDVRGRWKGVIFTSSTKKGKVVKREKPLTRQAIYNIVKQRAKQAGIAHITCHDLRRTFITEMIANGKHKQAQTYANHKDISTTFKYDRSSRELAHQAVAERHF